MREALKSISVIVPFTEHDLLWKDLLQDLKILPKETEIILVGPHEPDAKLLRRATEEVIASVRYVPSEKGRGRQLNAGARNAGNDYFWFLHADSKVPRPAVFSLAEAIGLFPEALHYFDLQFLNDGPRLVGLNSFAANLRSKYLGLPFGDQGFAISRAQFYKVGGFPEAEPYGEDHCFVWEARRKRVPLHRVGASIFTSARRYEMDGWGRVTRQRVYLTFRQATEQYIKLVMQRAVE